MAPEALRKAASTVSAELNIADLSQGHGLTDRYDPLLLEICDTSVRNLSDNITDSTTRFCHHIRHALNADTAYLCNRTSLTIAATSSTNSTQQNCDDTQELHAALTTMVNDLWNCTTTLCPPDIKVVPELPKISFCIIPLDTRHDHLLVIANTEFEDTLFGDYIADAVTASYEVFLQNNGHAPEHSVLEATVIDTLQRNYQLSSKAFTKRRHEIFCQQVKESAVEFDGLSLVKIKDKPEALTTILPTQLYDVAALWTEKYKATLDTHCLVESAYGYKVLCDNESLSKFSDGRSLKIRVHAETLSDYGFIETLRDLTEKAILHSSKIIFSVVPEPGNDHAAALNSLCSRFAIPQSKRAAIPTTSPQSIADEFNLIQIHGVQNSATRKKIQKEN